MSYSFVAQGEHGGSVDAPRNPRPRLGHLGVREWPNTVWPIPLLHEHRVVTAMPFFTVKAAGEYGAGGPAEDSKDEANQEI